MAIFIDIKINFTDIAAKSVGNVTCISFIAHAFIATKMEIAMGGEALEPERMEGAKKCYGVSTSAQCHYNAFARGKKSTGENYVSHFFLK